MIYVSFFHLVSFFFSILVCLFNFLVIICYLDLSTRISLGSKCLLYNVWTYSGSNRLRIPTVAANRLYGLLSLGGIEWDGWVSFNFYMFFFVFRILSVKNLPICVIEKILIFFVIVFLKIHSCLGVSSGLNFDIWKTAPEKYLNFTIKENMIGEFAKDKTCFFSNFSYYLVTGNLKLNLGASQEELFCLEPGWNTGNSVIREL